MRVRLLLLAPLVAFGCAPAAAPPEAPPEAAGPVAEALQESPAVPAWAADAVFYQIFPERFRNGDPANDPTRASLETPYEGRVPASWAVTPWTSDWYARAPWEQARGDDFYEDGVFDRRYGGDLQGVLDRLDYLQRLGVTALYFNPIFYGRSLHKYDGNSFHHVDPYFGPDPAGDLALMAEETSDPATWQWTAADRLFLRLVREAHRRGLRVVLDGVFNHTGRDFFAFSDLRRNQERSPYKDWYVVERFDDPATPEDEFAYEGWYGIDTLPVFAETAGGDLHPGPRRYVFDATRRWMDPDGDGNPADGIDGWRLDAAEQVSTTFWRDWNAFVRSLNPEAYTVAELWLDAAAFVAEGGFSATMNYYGFAFPVKGFLIDRTLAAPAFAEMLAARRTAYPLPVQYALLNLVDSHDTERLASMIVNAGRRPYGEGEVARRFGYDWGDRVSPRADAGYQVRAPRPAERDLQRLVALFQMTYVGPPMVYYGTEAGLWGGDDPDDRKPMLWPDLRYDDEAADPLGRARRPDPVAFDPALFDYYRDVVALRRAHAPLRRGLFEVLLADAERGVLAYRRALAGDALVVVLNPGEVAHSVRVPVGEAAGRYAALFATRPGSRLQQDAAALLLELPPRTGLVLHAASR